MAHLPIQCQNCGAKYKIPETFPGDFAKCKACGTKIDVKAARDGQSTETETSSRTSTKRSTGGSRKPRQAAETKSSGRPTRDEDKATARTGRRGAAARKRSDGDEEEGDRRGYEKKKDNSTVLLFGSLGVLAIVAIILVMVWSGEEGATKTTTAKKDAGSKNVAAPKVAGADAKVTDTGPEAEKAAADKAAADKAAADKAAAEKKKKAAAKPKISSEVKVAADVFKPSSLDKLPNAEGTTEEDVTTINEQLDYLKEGGGLSFIRAPKKLQDIGAKMIPLAVNRMMTLDYSKAEDNQYAFAISHAIYGLTEFELAFDPARIVDEFKLTQGHDNAKKVKDLHLLTRKYWGTDKSIREHIAKRNK